MVVTQGKDASPRIGLNRTTHRVLWLFPEVFVDRALQSLGRVLQWTAVKTETISSWRYVAPNAVTCIGLSVALLSIMSTFSGQYEDAAWLILFCCLIDKLDGTVARLLNGSSSFGVQMDSFSDLVAFGVAPGLLFLGMFSAPLYEDYYQSLGMFWMLRVAVIFLIVMSVIRLAKFNVMTEQIGSKIFLGIPTTLVGAVTASFLLTAMKFDWPVEIVAYTPIALFVLGLWMVSNIRMPKVRKTTSLGYNIFIGVNVVVTWVCVPLRLYPEYVLALSGGYAFIGSIYATCYFDTPEVRETSDEDAAESE
jgi:CDP-diacylglycerol--serine O-phosphatidyltransferase